MGFWHWVWQFHGILWKVSMYCSKTNLWNHRDGLGVPAKINFSHRNKNFRNRTVIWKLSLIMIEIDNRKNLQIDLLKINHSIHLPCWKCCRWNRKKNTSELWFHDKLHNKIPNFLNFWIFGFFIFFYSFNEFLYLALPHSTDLSRKSNANS